MGGLSNELEGLSGVSSDGGGASITINSSNGFAGDVVDSEITLKTTVAGIIKGNGTALEEAEAGIDYATPSDAFINALIFG